MESDVLYINEEAMEETYLIEYTNRGLFIARKTGEPKIPKDMLFVMRIID